jgi:hypothetical protein
MILEQLVDEPVFGEILQNVVRPGPKPPRGVAFLASRQSNSLQRPRAIGTEGTEVVLIGLREPRQKALFPDRALRIVTGKWIDYGHLYLAPSSSPTGPFPNIL